MLGAADITVVSQVPATISAWMECLVWTMGAVYLSVSLYQKARGKPAHPPNEQLDASQAELGRRVKEIEGRMVGKEWFDNMDADMATCKADLKKDRDDNEKHISARASKIYEEMKQSNESVHQQIKAEGERRVIQIDDVRKELSKNLESVRQELSENQRLLPNEIVTLLKNTNAI